MHQLIADFSKHIDQAIKIGSESQFNQVDKSFSNVLVCGLGGSGIGGTNVQKVLEKELKIPFATNKGYHLPAWVSNNTLVICCSYSGNTEETLAMYKEAKQRGSEIAVVCSGGEFEKIAKNDSLNYILIPGGLPPRAAFGLAFPQLLFVLNKYRLISDSFVGEFNAANDLINQHEDQIREEAMSIAKMMHNRIPVLYAEDRWEGVLTRMRQQLNENSKMLAWHHVVPELNHNELVGWKKSNENLAVILLRDADDYYRNKSRFEYTRSAIQKCTENFKEIKSKGDSFLEKCIYFIHLGDWVSFYLADLQNIDSVEVDVISGLKDMLSDLE